LNSKADSESDSDIDSEADSETRIGANRELLRIGVATPKQELHQNRSIITLILDISANQTTIT
jgi:hypothetical protein